jgi:putative ABC transport system substrate-binding protein
MTLRAVVIAVMTTSATLAVHAQPAQKMHRVGFIATISPAAEISGPDPANPFVRAFVHALRDLGYVGGRNLALEMRTLEGKPERLEPLVEELAKLKVEAVFIPSPALVLRAVKVAPDMPIVALVGPDLLAAKTVQSLARPGGNVTGPSLDLEDDVEGKRLELLLELAPGARRVAYVGLREDWSRPFALSLRAMAQRLGIDLVLVESGYGDFAPAFARLREEKVQGIVIERSARAYGRRKELGALAAASGLPSSCAQGELVEHGCLISYSTDANDLGRRAAGYVARILKGARPGELAIEAPTKFELTINLKTAKELGLAVPQSVLLRADRVIE